MMLPKRGIFKTAGSKEIDAGIVRGFGNANLGVLRRHLPLRLGDIRAALQNV